MISPEFESRLNLKSLINSSLYENTTLIITQMAKICTLLKIFFFYKFPVVKVLALTVYTNKKEEQRKITENFNNAP